VAHLAIYENLYLFFWSFDCHLCKKAIYNAAFCVTLILLILGYSIAYHYYFKFPQHKKHAMTSQIRVLTKFVPARKRTWRQNLHNSRTFTSNFSFTKMIWTEILQEQYIEGIILFKPNLFWDWGPL
jgi:hypothetical protein